MKKFLGIVIIAAALTACNNSADSTNRAKDSLDSVAGVKKELIDSSADAKKDAVDSLTNAKKEVVVKSDSLNKKDSLHK
jgi:hypothetical protein